MPCAAKWKLAKKTAAHRPSPAVWRLSSMSKKRNAKATVTMMTSVAAGMIRRALRP